VCEPFRFAHGDALVDAMLELPPHPIGVMVFAQGYGGTLTTSQAGHLCAVLARAGIGSLRIEVTDEAEAIEPCHVHDAEALADLLDGAVRRLGRRPETAGLPPGLLGAGTGSAAVLLLAARPGRRFAAAVCLGGRPDLAGRRLNRVRVPVLLIAGTGDHAEIPALRAARTALNEEAALILVPHAVRRTDPEHEFAARAQVVRDWLRPRLAAFARP
jgi:dienelactone hydrolase